jgi:hypothetical protein
MANYKGPLDYIDVATRIIEFREKYPTGSLQQVKLEFVTVNNKDWVVYTAAAFRTPEDIRPGIGTAWEPIPGPTNFTRDSEVQNAETAAWGRAMVAALARRCACWRTNLSPTAASAELPSAMATCKRACCAPLLCPSTTNCICATKTVAMPAAAWITTT